nr:MAG TPA: hypothetical protein [Caudoviricetes sp.]
MIVLQTIVLTFLGICCKSLLYYSGGFIYALIIAYHL